MRLFKQYKTFPKDEVEFALRLREEPRLATYIAHTLALVKVAKRKKQDGVTSDAWWECRWHTCSDLAEQTQIDFTFLKKAISGGEVRTWRNIGDDCFAFLVSVYPCIPQRIKRDIYVCAHCEAIYRNEPVSECDCTLGREDQLFIKGSAVYTLPPKQN